MSSLPGDAEVLRYAATEILDVRETSLCRNKRVSEQRRGTRKTVEGHAQVSPIVPYGIGEVTTQGVNQDLVLVELQDDVGEPPESFALQAFSVAGRSSRGL